jgi:hypothetical protein
MEPQILTTNEGDRTKDEVHFSTMPSSDLMDAVATCAYRRFLQQRAQF